MKAFVRSLEVIFAAALLLLVYPVLSIKIQPISMEEEYDFPKTFLNILDSLNVENYLSNFDFRAIDSIFYNYFSDFPYGLQFEYFIPIKIKNEDQFEKNTTISFSYNFPLAVDKNSVEIINHQVDVRWVWYRIPILLRSNSSLSNSNIELKNVTLNADSEISNKSLIFFFENKKQKISLKSWNPSSNNLVNVSIIANIPFMEANESYLCYLYYATNSSFADEIYYQLQKNTEIQYSFGSPQEASRADIILNISFSPLEEKNLILKYNVGTEGNSNYVSFESVNNSGINYEYIDEINDGNYLIYGTSKGTNVWNKLFCFDDKCTNIKFSVKI